MLSSGQHRSLTDRGFVSVRGDRSGFNLLKLAKSLGNPVPSKPGALVISELRPKRPSEEQTRTFSSVYGLGSFPFHTDTAHWPIPARFVILRDVGISHDRPTLLLPMDQFTDAFDLANISGSIWKIKGPFGSFFSSILAYRNGIRTVRYDPMCMRPANHFAIRFDEMLSARDCQPVRFDWKPSLVLIIDNWRMLHARGASSSDDSRSRCLERVLIFDNEQLPLFPYVLAA